MSQKTAIMIPIHPPYIEDIIEGTKETEYRTTKPKLNPPFKMYLYASKTNDKTDLQKGTVVAECMCRGIKKNWGRV